MEYLYGSRPKISVRAEGGDEGIFVPYLGDVGDVRTMQAPTSGYDRANWFAQNTMGVPRDRAVFASANGRASIGANARGVNGPESDDYVTDSYWTGYNVVNLPEQYTEQADNVGTIWKVQTQASKGLNYLTWDQVYVNEDSQSIWS
jgi:hypothetical protein